MVAEEPEVLYDGERTRVVRALTPDGPVIRKQCRGGEDGLRIRAERTLLQRLSGVPGVPRLAETAADETSATLSMVDTGHISLESFAADGIPGVAWLIGFARDLAQVLAGVHAAGVLHHDLSPANILVRRDGSDPFLADYDLATTFAEDRPDFTHPSEIAGTLPYLSPECTGRMGRAVDQRADLYSFGAVLYELATGGPPFGFGSQDPLELIHAHLALEPVPPSDLRPDIPGPLSDIVLRLLAKEPDHRYASAEGLAHDLARLAASPDQAMSFPLGSKDFPPRLAAPSRLIGREAEIGVLQEAFDAVRSGGTARGLLVAGPPGVGKSALLDRLRPMVTTSGSGWFVTGKFDQYRHDQISDAVVQSLRSLGRLVLAEPEDACHALRDRLLAALGSNAGHLAATLPEFATLLGVPARPAEGDPVEVTQRSYRAFVEVLLAVAGPARPVVLVLDDLQWASGFALGALDAILTDVDLSGLLVVGGYRDGEVDPAHPLAAMTARWQRLEALAATLTLDNLPDADMGTFLADMLRMPQERAAELATAIAEHARGNPFDTVELVNALRREGGLTLTDIGWQWDAGDVRRFIGTGDVLQLIDQRLARLPESTRDLMQTMTCLGGAVELPLLREVAGLRADATPDLPHPDGSSQPEPPSGRISPDGDWVPALEEGLLVLEGGRTPALRFRHDRVQQAVHASLSSQSQRARHLALARRLSARGEAFEPVVAEQYLAAVDELTEPAERRRVAALFDHAAERALAVANHEVVERYLGSAIGLLTGEEGPEGSGQPSADTELLLRLNLQRHAALYALRRFEETDKVFAWLQERCEEPVVRARAAVVQISSLTHRGRLAEAVVLGSMAMAELGHPTPVAEELGEQIGLGLQRLHAWVTERGEEPQLDRPECDDPRLQALGQIVNRMVPATFFSANPLMAWLVTEAARLWDGHGATPDLVGPLAHAAFVTIAAAGDYRTGSTVVRRVLAESAGRGYEPAHSEALFLHSLSSAPWFEPMSQIGQYAREAREGLIRGGDLWNASFTYFSSAHNALGTAQTLAEAEAEVDAGLALTARTGDAITSGTLVTYRQTLRALQGRTAAPGSLDDDSFDSQEYLAALGNDATGAANLHGCEALLAAVFDDPSALERHTAALMPLLPYVEATQVTTQARLWRALALIHQPDLTREGATAELDECQAWIARRAAEAPANFGYLEQFLRAERDWAAGDVEEAARWFDRACGSALVACAPGHRALIVERYGRFQLSRGLDFAGRMTLHRARHLFAAWGAEGKVARLEEEFPFLQDPLDAVAARRRGGTHHPHAVTDRPSTALSTHEVDLVAILRAFQVLSTETSPARLQDRVAEVLALLTGATQVRLALRDPDSGEWSLPSPGDDEPAMTPLTQAAAQGLIPLAPFRYVERTGETLVVDDAVTDVRFSGDPYFGGMTSCAVLVIPVAARGGPRAVLLLENRLARGAFTARRQDAVELIAGELGICLEHMLAERFRSLVQRSAELTVVCDRAAVVSYASAACPDLVGLKERQVVGRRLGELFDADDRAEVVRQLEQVKAGEAVTLTARLRHADGQPRWADVTLTDLTAEPAVGGVMVRLRDVTERHRLEIELRHAQKLESVGQLASGIAHEINTPMQFITTNLRFLTEAFAELAEAPSGASASAAGGEGDGEVPSGASGGAPSETVAELLTEIPTALAETIEGAERVVTIVRAMKTFGHPGGMSKGWADINEAVQNTLVVAANEIRPAADVVTEFGELPQVWCNLGDVNQAVLNLVINASQAMGEKVAAGGLRGTLSVRTRADGDDVLIDVADTGVGIQPEIASRVFDQFFTTKDVGVGTGQGLALAHALVHDHHGGSITFTSTPGVGTTFTIRLPKKRD